MCRCAPLAALAGRRRLASGRPRAAEIAPRRGYRMQGPVSIGSTSPIPGMTATATSAGSSA